MSAGRVSLPAFSSLSDDAGALMPLSDLDALGCQSSDDGARPRWGYRGETLENIGRVAQLVVSVSGTDAASTPLTKTVHCGVVTTYSESSVQVRHDRGAV